MDNKLSELSKPVAWVTMQREFCDDERSVITDQIAAEKYSLECYDLTPVYSQEYVSALLADNEAKDKRIAELEVGENIWESATLKHLARAEAAEKQLVYSKDAIATWERKAISNFDECAKMSQRIEELEDKLATPVRLPNKNDDEFWFDGVFQVEKFDRAVERAISAAGFKFVGDKQ